MRFIGVGELKNFISIMSINGFNISNKEKAEDYRKLFRYDTCLSRINAEIEYIPQGFALNFSKYDGTKIKRIVFFKEGEK